MLQYRFSAIWNITKAKTFGKPAMFICDAENKAPANKRKGYGTKAWNRFFRQSLDNPIQS